MLKAYLKKIVDGNDLSFDEARSAMEIIMSGEASTPQIASFITALRMKGETVDEISAFASVMREKAEKIETKCSNLVDTCGTGGDLARTFNISTAAAFIAAGAGVVIAKHGNRAVSSNSGSADVLEALGVEIDIPLCFVGECIDEVGIGFIFAPSVHKAMKHAMEARREVGIRTVFNILGPLTNPARASAQLLGVFDVRFAEIMARALMNLGTRRAMIVHGAEGIDEISVSGETMVMELKNDRIFNYVIRPEEFGMERSDISDVVGGSPERNAEIIKLVLEGKAEKAVMNIALLNAAATIYVAGIAERITDGIVLAKRSISSGNALGKLETLIEMTKRAKVQLTELHRY
ncbi:MAG: anthranilate phosphoribosyltransferase [Actinobacteria bacterium]|nr:anthranilate phosphoribosyltransferase [Actinomycetota bacterium]